MLRFRAVIISVLFIICVLSLSISDAAEVFVDDGFETARKIESRYFDIYIENGIDLQTLAMKLSVPLSIKSIIREPAAFSDSYTLSDQLDTLFLAVSEIMDMKLKKFRCTFKICRNRSRLSDVAKRLFGREIRPCGFYVTAIDTIYIDAETVTINLLGHELGHAIQVHYFVVPPPVKIQEILAGYVEFQLRKYTNTLPE
ncbi:MAG: hypothetical protein KAU58_03820 [Candidatus Omnitrophica bacterium]|nr:hypothetical protein [Candidatus Omnitrophota bacterium]